MGAPFGIYTPPDPLLPNTTKGKLSTESEKCRFKWHDWFSCGGCPSLLVVVILIVIFGDDLLRFVVRLITQR